MHRPSFASLERSEPPSPSCQRNYTGGQRVGLAVKARRCCLHALSSDPAFLEPCIAARRRRCPREVKAKNAAAPVEMALLEARIQCLFSPLRSVAKHLLLVTVLLKAHHLSPRKLARSNVTVVKERSARKMMLRSFPRRCPSTALRATGDSASPCKSEAPTRTGRGLRSGPRESQLMLPHTTAEAADSWIEAQAFQAPHCKAG